MNAALVTAVVWYFLGPYHKQPPDPDAVPPLVVDREPDRVRPCPDVVSPWCGSDYRLWGDAEYLLFWTRADATPAGGSVDFGATSGGRFTAGGWVGAGEAFGVEGSYLFLGRQSAATLVPGVGGGSLPATETSRVWGAEANGVVGLFRHSRARLDGLVGFRYLNLDEQRTATDTLTTRNQFYGGQVGLRGELASGPVWVAVRGKVAFGRNEREVGTEGGRVTNSGSAVVPEAGVTAGCRVTDQVGVTVGYTWVGVTNVARPGGLTDLGAPAGGRVATTDFWVQGVSLGLRVEW